MKATDRLVLVGIGVLALIAAFWFFVLSPKREEAAQLGDEIAALETAVAEQQQAASIAEEARQSFDANYKQLVRLGKAVPESDDTSSFFAQLTAVSDRAEVQLRGIELAEGTGEAPVAAPPPTTETETTPTETATGGAEAAETAAEGTTPAPATEASAATLPIGATVGTAGLPVMPYGLSFRGDFFEMADFFDELDDSIHIDREELTINGRLVTVDGFAFKADPRSGFPNLFSNVAVTSYVTPADQGALAGATPGGPPTTVPPGTTAPTSTPPASTEAGATATSTTTP